MVLFSIISILAVDCVDLVYTLDEFCSICIIFSCVKIPQTVCPNSPHNQGMLDSPVAE